MKLLQKFLLPANYFFLVNLTRLHGVIIPWFRPQERCLRKILKDNRGSFVDELFKMRREEEK